MPHVCILKKNSLGACGVICLFCLFPHVRQLPDDQSPFVVVFLGAGTPKAPVGCGRPQAGARTAVDDAPRFHGTVRRKGHLDPIRAGRSGPLLVRHLSSSKSLRQSLRWEKDAGRQPLFSYSPTHAISSDWWST